MSKARCRQCAWLNYDFLSDTYERDLPPFCGLHGRERIDLNGEQRNLDHMGGCGFKTKYEQLTLFD